MFVSEQTIGRIKVYEQRNAIQKNAHIGNYFISKEKFDTMQGFIVEPGDIIVSCAGTIGEIYILPDNSEIGIINQALMRIRLYYKGIEEYFVLYFDSILKKEANEKGMGSTIKNIPPFDILKKMLLPLPPLNEIQRILEKISFIINEINEINTNYDDISKLVIKIKSKILDNFFGEDSSYKSYYENYRPIRELCHTLSVTSKEVKLKDVKPEGKFPVVSQSKQLIDGYSDNQNNVISDIPIIIFGDHTRVVKYINFHFIPGADGTKILKTINLESKYFYYGVLYASGIIDNKGYARHFSKLKNVLLPIPNKQNQNKIVKYLDNAFKLLDSIV
jgi:putative uncharacterized protein (fragment)